MTAGAALLGLPTPRIAVGEPANLALLDLDASWEVGAPAYASKLGELAASTGARCAASCA